MDPEFADGQKIPGSDNGTEPQVVMGANEETTVIWKAMLSGTFANRAIGRVLGTAQSIDGGAPIRDWSVMRTVRRVMVSSGSDGKVFATRFIRGSGWHPQQEISADLLQQGFADVAMDDNGRALVVWEQVITATPDPLDTRIATAIIGAPVARFSSSPDPAQVNVTVVFDATASSDPGGSIARYDWDYTGDGVPDAVNVSSIFNHVFTQAGTYRVKLVVTDNSGLVSEAFKDVVVGASSLYGINLPVNPSFDSAGARGLLADRARQLAGRCGDFGGRRPRHHSAQRTEHAALRRHRRRRQHHHALRASSGRSSTSAASGGRHRRRPCAALTPAPGSTEWSATPRTDRRFDIRLLAFNVAAVDLPAAYVAGTQLAVQAASIQTVGNVWQQAALNMTLPAGTRLLLVEIYAFEDVLNDGTTPEFAGHYADDISLVLTRN